MNNPNEITLWKGKTKVETNFWGLNYESRGTNLDPISGSGYGGATSPLLSLCIAVLFALISSYCLLDLPIIGVLYSILISFAILYRWVIREIKYYQLAKRTVYEITEDKILIHYSFLGLKRTKKILLEDIDLFHLLRYKENEKGEELGSIWIYSKKRIKTYDILKRERTITPKIEKIEEYQQVFNMLNSMQKRIKNQRK